MTPSLFCICILFIIFNVVLSSDVRGVAPEEQVFYKQDPFKCRNEPTRQIPLARVNDDYCDCADGSDEPGTSACVCGIFYCSNKGYKGETIFASRVNDGICDCCDGEDEFQGKVKCKNTCFEKGAELRKQAEEERAKLEKGLLIKQKWIADAVKTINDHRESVDGHKAQVEKLQKVVEDLEAEKKGFEEKERAEQEIIRERKKEIERIEQERLAKEAPATPENEANEQEALKELLDKKEGESELTPEVPEPQAHEEQPQTHEEQARAHEEQPQTQAHEGENYDGRPGEEHYGNHPHNGEDDYNGQPRKGFSSRPRRYQPIGEQLAHAPQPEEEETELLKIIREGSGDTEQTSLIKSLFETYQDCKDWLVSSLYKYHIISTEEEKRVAFYTEGKKKIEDELSQVRRDLSNAESTLRDTEELLKQDFGPNNEFFALHKNCYDYKTREYTYTICPYGDAKQGHTNLGKFEKWDPPYTAMLFSNGQQCWGGPNRSAKVTFICGAESELYDIQEPNKCEYTMKLDTPAACHASTLEFLEHGADHHH